MSLRLETLPPETFGTILDRLNWMTGTEGIVNQSDFPVIMKQVCNLMLTSRTIYELLHNPIATGIFLESLSRKYGKSIEHFAVQLDMKSSRIWIWQHVQKNSYDAAYDVIQKIYGMTTALLGEAQAIQAGAQAEAQAVQLDFRVRPRDANCPVPIPHYFPTQTGFQLRYKNFSLALTTPFGEVQLYQLEKDDGSVRFAIVEALINRMHATFDRIAFTELGGPASDRAVNFKVLTSGELSQNLTVVPPRRLVPLGEAQLELEKGTQNLIFNGRHKGPSIYNIARMEQLPLPPVSWPPRETRLFEQAPILKTMWQMLERKRQGLEPTERPPVVIAPVLPVIPRSNISPLNIKDAAEMAVRFIYQLAAQPIHPTYTPRIKILSMEDWSSARFTQTLSALAYNLLPSPHRLEIYLLVNEQTTSYALQLLVNSSNGIGLQEVRPIYEALLSDLGANWEAAQLKDHPDILIRESEEEYNLFIKKTSTAKELLLIPKLADLFNLSKAVICSNSWDGPLRADPPTYLWIKKNRCQEAFERFGLRHS